MVSDDEGVVVSSMCVRRVVIYEADEARAIKKEEEGVFLARERAMVRLTFGCHGKES